MTTRASVRSPAVAGLFYDDDPAALRHAVANLLAGSPSRGAAPHAVIAPHAGYVYSGAVAARAYNRVAAAAQTIRRVVILGPAHRVPLRGIALPTVEYFRTPLGDIPIDRDFVATLRGLPEVCFSDLAHQDEHSIEVQLPFLQTVLDVFSLVPLVVGVCNPSSVANLLEQIWNEPETLIVISSDLSHYHSYHMAQELDANTARRIEALETSIEGSEACGAYPLNGLLQVARNHHLHLERLDLRNSGDTAGPKTRVVGYGTWVIGNA